MVTEFHARLVMLIAAVMLAMSLLWTGAILTVL